MRIGVAFFLLGLAPLVARNSTIQGVVTDSTGAVVPGVQIAVTNVATSVVTTVDSNEQGLYSVPFLTPGTYRIAASKAGFSSLTQENLKLDVDQTARVDFTLKVGAVAETIEVSAAAALIDSQTSVVGQVIDNKRIVELPLNGRNYLELARLTTAVVATTGSRTDNKGSFSALGQHAYQTNILLDGIDNNSRASGGQLGFEAQAVTPSIDSVAEFKVVTNNNSAEYGFRMGGTVIVSTKPGGNQFHGSLYEFLRNDKLDGTNFFAVGRPKPPLRMNQFGGTLGGPVIRNRSFFFASYEGTRIRLGQSNISTVPAQAFKDGDFRGVKPLFDPRSTRQEAGNYVRDPFPENRIPAARFDPVSVKAVALYPVSNRGGLVNNYFFSAPKQDDTDQVDVRGDHNFTDRYRFFARYSRRKYDSVAPGPLPLPADGGLWSTTTLTSHSLVAALNQTLSARMNNELRFGFTPTHSTLDIPWTENMNAKLGVKGLPDLGDDNQRGSTRFTPSAYVELGARSFWPNRNNLEMLQFFDNLLMTRGRHALKMGVEFRREELFRRAARFSRGQMAFDGSFTQNPSNRGATGDGMADFLLGLASGGNLGNQNGETAVTRNYSLYFQDDWRITSRLTLNLGVRWDRFGPPSFRLTPVSRFELTLGSQEYRIVRPADESDCGCEHDNNNFAPRVGLAWQATPKTVIRSGFGIFYGQPDAIAHDGDARFYHQPPDFTEIGFPTDRLLQPALVVSQGFPPGLLPTTVIRENVTVKPALKFIPTQYSMQWFYDVQRELPFDTVLTLSYIGSGTHHLVQTRNLNQPFTPGPGSIKSRQPWTYFGSIPFRDPLGNSSYQALAAKAEKRYRQGLTMLASYTWAHTIDFTQGTLDDAAGTGPQDNWNLRRNRGNSVYDVRQRFVLSGVYDLPAGRGRKWLNMEGPVDWILGGWQVGSILFVRAGMPFTPTINTDISNTGTTNRPDRLGNGSLPAGERSVRRWFDVTAFAIPRQYTYGNTGRNVLTGPGYRGMDLKIGKNFTFGEGRRVEFRCEMFNFSNTPHFDQPNTNVNIAQGGTITSAQAPRQIQLGLKFVY